MEALNKMTLLVLDVKREYFLEICIARTLST